MNPGDIPPGFWWDPREILKKNPRENLGRSRMDPRSIPVGSRQDPRLKPDRSQIYPAWILHNPSSITDKSQSDYRGIPKNFSRDSEQIPEKSQKGNPSWIPLKRPQRDSGQIEKRSQRKILGFVWENSSVLRLFPAFPTAFPGRRQSQELHHLLQRYLPN